MVCSLASKTIFVSIAFVVAIESTAVMVVSYQCWVEKVAVVSSSASVGEFEEKVTRSLVELVLVPFDIVES